MLRAAPEPLHPPGVREMSPLCTPMCNAYIERHAPKREERHVKFQLSRTTPVEERLVSNEEQSGQRLLKIILANRRHLPGLRVMARFSKGSRVRRGKKSQHPKAGIGM